ncbi:hypothetical protein B0T21DRAFT_349296 [Apiosordaria backusii]|uniref:Uncharacterized protein n=1 Tax=Apiosordaria backusii TaxID=314023 RepID=A0AA40BKD8_9PEZI|nr:hypothetical protein B0T21DRAFT_349296 [Apiosordaria backusii]
MDSPNSSAPARQRSAATAGLSSVAAGVSSAAAVPPPVTAATDLGVTNRPPPVAAPSHPEHQSSRADNDDDDFFDLPGAPLTTTTATNNNNNNTTLTKWQEFPPPPLSHYNTPHHHPSWNPTLPKPPEKHSSLAPELEKAIATREKAAEMFAKEQEEIAREILGVDERIKEKRQALEEVRNNKRQLQFERGKDKQTVMIEMEDHMIVEQGLLEELGCLGQERRFLEGKGREGVEGWLRGEWRGIGGIRRTGGVFATSGGVVERLIPMLWHFAGVFMAPISHCGGVSGG